MSSLTQKKCRPCGAQTPPLPPDRAGRLLLEIPGWEIVGGKSIRKEFLMRDFLAVVHFIDAIAPVAEAEGHHPDIHLTGYRRLAIELSTHAIGGLSENDFILASKIDSLPKELKT